MTAREIRFPLALIECLHLAGLVEEFLSVIASTEDTADPALARLTPNPYPQDEHAAAEFAAVSRGDLLERRAADAAVVRGDLEPFIASEESDQEQSLDRIDVVIRPDEIDAWLRTLTAIRLVIATRLGIVDDEADHDPEDPRYGVYDWLAFRLDGLIAIADALDDIPEEL